MLEFLKKSANIGYTENGAVTNLTSDSHCLDLFFRAGAMRNANEQTIANAVMRAYTENPEKTMKIIFFARDVRGGLGERRFFRIAVRTLARYATKAVERNIPYFAEYGRFDDLCVLLDTFCCESAVAEIKRQLDEDVKAMQEKEPVSLLAKWMPSVNASSEETKKTAKKLAKKLGMTEQNYRKTLSALRKYIDILENNLRERDYSFEYSKQPSKAMLKYQKAFIRNDETRYTEFIKSVQRGEVKLNTSALYPYDIVRKVLWANLSEDEKNALNVTWENLPNFGNGSENQNAIAVVDGSGSMTCTNYGNVRPIDVALSLGIYFAEHNSGVFANHFITFSHSPRLVEIKGSDIYEKVNYCATYNEVANTDLEAVFRLILTTAVNNKLPQEQLPSRIYIISDMEFDYCVYGGNSMPMFESMEKMYKKYGYELPNIIFWNVNSRSSNVPVKMSRTGAALVSGASPAIFDMVASGELSPEKIMNDIIMSERYAKIA